MTLLVVIVNYKTAGLTVDCLRTVEAERGAVEGGCRVVVTDNASPDDSAAVLRDAIDRNGWADWCELRVLPTNGGFAYGNNEGIRPALDGPGDKPEFVLLLNPDTLVRPGAFAALVDYMRLHPDIGLAGSRLEDPDGTPQRSAFRFHGVASEVESGLRLGLVSRLLSKYVVAPPVPQHAEAVDWVCGGSMIVRREVFEKIGLMDERYFMYFEEVDFCLRASRAGFRCAYVPTSRVVHLVGQASGVTDRAKANRRRPAYWFESRRRYFVKNHGVAYAALADVAFAASFGLWRLRRFVQRKPDPDPAHLLGDVLRHSVLRRGGAA